MGARKEEKEGGEKEGEKGCVRKPRRNGSHE